MAGFFQDSLKLLSKTLVHINNEKDMENFLSDLLTPQEIVDIADRINIIKLLKRWKTQRDIAEEIWISITTVNRGSRVLKYGTGSADKYIN